jgi:4-hydroxybutyrate CoA-transferase
MWAGHDTTYGGKLVPAEAAVQVIRSGDRVAVGRGDEPLTLLTALAGRVGEVESVEIFAERAAEFQVWFSPGVETSFSASVLTAGSSSTREAIAARLADYYPTLYSLTFKALDERPAEAAPFDVLLLSVAPPDENGFCSLGFHPWRKPSLVRRARTVIAEVDPGLPRTAGPAHVHVADIDLFTEKLVESPPRGPKAASEQAPAIAGYLRELIRDGDTLQIGGGSTTDPLPRLGIFEGKRDLGWHSEVTPPGVVTAMMAGIITGARKSVHRGKLVTASLNADDDEVLYATENPLIELRDVSEVNDIRLIAAQENMVAINNAIAVDLTGQIVAEGLGPRIWSGMGGQPEFAIGAVLARGGRSITVLPSVTSGGISRICAQLPAGSYVTVPRYFADTVVTEWGVARLLGKSQRQRAEELIAIAHPDHRADLRREAKRQFWP